MKRSVRPTTTVVQLWNDALRRPTEHRYVTSRPVEPRAWEHIFRCTVTGAERKYGLDERSLSDETIPEVN